MRSKRAPQLVALAPTALALLAGWVRWSAVWRQPLGPDAAELAAVGAHPTPAGLLHSAAPGWTAVEALIAVAVGTHTSLLRTLSLLTFGAAVAAFQVVATRLAGRLPGLAAAAVLALLPGFGVAAVDGGPEMALTALLIAFGAGLLRLPRRGRPLSRWTLAAAGLLLLLDWRTVAFTAPLMLAVARLSTPTPRALAVAAGAVAVAMIRVLPSVQRLGPNAIHAWNDALAVMPVSAIHLVLVGDNRRLGVGAPGTAILLAPDLLLAVAALIAAVLVVLRRVPTRYWVLAALTGLAALYLIRIATLEPVSLVPALPLAALAALAPARPAVRLWPAVRQRVALAVVAAAGIVFTVSSYARLEYIQSGTAGECYDTCILTQAIWNAAHGNGMRVTTWFGFDSLLAQHAFLNQWLLVPVYYLWHDILGILFATQSVALGAVGVAGFMVARALGADPLESAAVALLALVHPSLAGASTGYALGIHFYGYHPDTVFPLLFLLAYLSYLRRNWPALAAAGALSITTHEAYSLVWIGVGAVWFLRGERRLGAAVAAGAAAWLVFVTRVLIPSAAHGASPYYFFALTSHGWPGILQVLEAFRDAAVGQLISWGGFPILSPIVLAGLPNLLVDASAVPGNYVLPVQITSWHALAFLPLMVIATASALVRIRTWRPQLRAPALALCALVGLTMADLSGSLYADLPPPNPTRATDLAWMASRVPEDASMSASQSAAGFFAQRRDLFIDTSTFHDPTASDYVLVEVKPRLPEQEADEVEMVRLMTNRQDFDLVAACDGLYLYHHRDSTPAPGSFGERTGAGGRCSRTNP